ncbi:TIGR00341 family protein [Enterococcus sp. 669A]|uniref:TIGR00341 family protein n=1 Tax=Candidatus Enterococcus moelleringii TaxID=2815325 RepID=A0ABS3LFW2_9ENTE|nr:TIGR00341 family protein [Enterococcus sp. 669A]MBO1308532.1 TIGR00341 family protein [Enterococcus sp. 669A]
MKESSVLTNQELYDKIYDGIYPKKENIMILVCAIVIASIGLNMNSQPVVIGAMLISPIMAPVQGLGMGLATFDARLTAKALKLLLLEAGFAIVAAAIYFLLSPITYASAEIISRTQPTIWDAIIAVFGGVAGMIGARQKEPNNIVPGVAIATTLMPPLCVMGYGLYERDASFFFGAAYLFLVNVSFIMITAFIVVQVLQVSKRKVVNKDEEKKRKYLMIGLALLIMIPSIYSAGTLVRKQVAQQNAQSFVSQEFTPFYVLKQEVDSDNHELVVDTIGSELSEEQVAQLQAEMANYNLNDYQLVVRQVADSDSLSLQDIDRYLEEKAQETRSISDTRPLSSAAANESINRQQEMIKRELFSEFPNRITSITLRNSETRAGEETGIVEVTPSGNVTEEDRQAIMEAAEKLTKDASDITVNLTD